MVASAGVGGDTPVKQDLPAQSRGTPESEQPKADVAVVDTTSTGTANEDDTGPQKHELRRGLSSIHMQMIAIGGSIGTGLFVGSGKALHTGGPLFLILNFALVGTMVYCVVMALAELATTLPVSGSFSTYSSRLIDPAWGFAIGWNYWLQWLIVLPFELTVATITIDYWGMHDKVSPGVWISIFLVLIAAIQIFGVRGYGNVEVAASVLKLTAIAVFSIVAIVIDLGGSPSHKYLGAGTWHNPGATHNGMLGFCSVFVVAAFAFSGTELVGLAARESVNPLKEIPKASKQVAYRIIIFYVLSLFLVGLIVPYDHPSLMGARNASSSPFVIAMKLGGVRILPDIFNAVILVSVLSVGNSAVFGASRTVAGMAHAGLAPRVLGSVDSKGRPIWAVAVSLLAGLLAFVEYAASKDVVFTWLLALSGLSTILTWSSICVCHIRFRLAWRQQGRTVEELPWRSPLGIWGSVFGLVFNIVVVICTVVLSLFPLVPAPTTAARVSSFFQSSLTIVIVVTLYLAAKWKGRTKIPSLAEIDLDSGREIVLTGSVDAENQT